MEKAGIFVVDKPKEISTNKLIQQIKHQFKLQKVGHAGTLDPLASGVVLCLVNQGTKLSEYLLNDDKQYQVTMKLFQATTTYDAEGEIVETQTPFPISLKTIKKVFNKYNGLTYSQQPPLYSAIKIKSKKLYEYARQNQEVAVAAREVTIRKITFLSFVDNNLTFEVNCSKGTYIRSLVVDLARDLDTIAYVSDLRRISSGFFGVNLAKNPEKLVLADLLSIRETLAIAQQPIINFSPIQKVLQGQKIVLPTNTPNQVFIANDQGDVVACYVRQKDDLFCCRRGGLNLN